MDELADHVDIESIALYGKYIYICNFKINLYI